MPFMTTHSVFRSWAAAKTPEMEKHCAYIGKRWVSSRLFTWKLNISMKCAMWRDYISPIKFNYEIAFFDYSRASVKQPPLKRLPPIRQPAIKVPKLFSAEYCKQNLYLAAISVQQPRPPFYYLNWLLLLFFPLLSGQKDRRVRSLALFSRFQPAFDRQQSQIKPGDWKNHPKNKLVVNLHEMLWFLFTWFCSHIT